MGFLDPVRSFGKTIWGHGDDEDYADDRDDNGDADSNDETYGSDYSGSYPGSNSYNIPSNYSAAKPSSSSSSYTPSYGGRDGGGGGNATSGNVRRLHPVSPTLRAREKNIYTIKPKRLDEATVAADCLKTGSAVIVNLEAVDRVTAIRIVDFMSGVCYGIDGRDGQPGHAMKLGEMIFLFTPAEFEITSDETDYAANREFFFREVSEGVSGGQSAAQPMTPPSPASPPASAASSYASSYNTPSDYSSERRAWER